MNRTLKRVLGTAGAVVVGLAGAVTFASSAQAHHVEIEGVTECADDGTWTVTWKVEDWFDQSNMGAGVIKEIVSEPDAAIDGDIQIDAELPPLDGGTPLEGTQVFSSDDVTSAKLTIWAEWPNGKYDKGEASVAAPTDCEPDEEPAPDIGVSAWSDCFAITITATNNNPEALAEFTFTPSEGEPVTGTPEVDEPLVQTFLVVDPDSEFSVAVTADGEDLDVFEWEGPGDCPVFDVAESCEGLTFDVEVPAEGTETTFTVVTSEGGEHSVTVAPGESGTIEVPVEADSIRVDWSYTDGKFIQPGWFDWNKPVCDEETTPAAQEQLPETGSSMTVMISAAAALVAAAAVLFVVARRRRAAAQDW